MKTERASDGSIFALKIMNKRLKTRREFEVLKHLEHRHIVHYVDLGDPE
jgi:hypothetical protein